MIDAGLTLQQLRYVLEVAASQSISEAADVLRLAQPTLSKSIKDIEARLGRTLFLRSSRGISLTADGLEFLGYARQVVEQANLLDERFLGSAPARRMLAVSTQHYAFAVNAFVAMVRGTAADEFEFTLRETRTHEIIEDVRTMRSELGILYRAAFNRPVLDRLFHDSGLRFTPLFIARPHVFVSRRNPLAARARVTPADLEPYPRLSFDQGDRGSFSFSEEILSTVAVRKSIVVSDRATIFNLMIGLDGYTISTGIINEDLNGPDIVAVPLDVDERIEVGWLAHRDIRLGEQAARYLDELRRVVEGFGVEPVVEDA